MSITDYYLICDKHQKKVFVTALHIAGFARVDEKEVGPFLTEHFYCDVRLGDEEDQYQEELKQKVEQS